MARIAAAWVSSFITPGSSIAPSTSSAACDNTAFPCWAMCSGAAVNRSSRVPNQERVDPRATPASSSTLRHRLHTGPSEEPPRGVQQPIAGGVRLVHSPRLTTGVARSGPMGEDGPTPNQGDPA